MTVAVISLNGPFHPGKEEISTGISFVLRYKYSFRLRQNNVCPHYQWTTTASKMYSFPFLHLYWLIGRADVPWGHPHGTLTPSCHSNDNSFICFHDPCCTLRPPRWAATVLLSPLFTFIFTVNSPNSTCPLFALSLQHRYLPIIPGSTSLYLICFSYSLSDLSLPFQHNPLLFTASTSPSANLNILFFFLFDLNETPYSMSSTVVLNNSYFVNYGLINIRLRQVHVFTPLVEYGSSSYEGLDKKLHCTVTMK